MKQGFTETRQLACRRLICVNVCVFATVWLEPIGTAWTTGRGSHATASAGHVTAARVQIQKEKFITFLLERGPFFVVRLLSLPPGNLATYILPRTRKGYL